MPCSETHFVPILDELRARLGPEAPPPSIARSAGRTWGGRRPGAGAPRGNTNALKTGEFSVRHRRFIQALASIPEIRETLFKLAAHQRRKERLSQLAAAAVLARLFQRAGEAVLNPAANQVGNNQDFLDFLRTTGAALLAYTEYQSKSEERSSEPPTANS